MVYCVVKGPQLPVRKRGSLLYTEAPTPFFLPFGWSSLCYPSTLWGLPRKEGMRWAWADPSAQYKNAQVGQAGLSSLCSTVSGQSASTTSRGHSPHLPLWLLQGTHQTLPRHYCPMRPQRHPGPSTGPMAAWEKRCQDRRCPVPHTPGRVSSGATDGGPGNLGAPAEGASGATCRSANLRALAQFVGPGQHTAAAAEKSLAILPGVRKPGLASPTSAASPGVTTAGGQQVAGELRGALTWHGGSSATATSKGRGLPQKLRKGRDPGEGRVREERAEWARGSRPASGGSPSARPRRRRSRLQPTFSRLRELHLHRPGDGELRWVRTL